MLSTCYVPFNCFTLRYFYSVSDIHHLEILKSGIQMNQSRSTNQILFQTNELTSNYARLQIQSGIVVLILFKFRKM